jgi:ribose/xylose/arabinose/galactoside ABC-type transport system permease subunit
MPAADIPATRDYRGADRAARWRSLTGVLALGLLVAVFGTLKPAFFSWENGFNVLNAVAITGILAVGQAFPLISGGFDLSQGAVAGLCGALTAKALLAGFPIPAAVAAGLAAGAALGTVNGLLVARVGINPFVATLGTQTAFSGLTFVLTNNQPQALGPQAEAFRQISYGAALGPLSNQAALFLLLAAALAFVLRFLPFGQHLYCLGGSEEATRLAGIDTVRLKVTAYLLSGMLAGAAAVVMIARAGQASPSEGRGTELDSLASCIIGGIALGGGVGSAWNVLLGAVTLGVITNGLQMIGAVVSPYWQLVIRGAVILAAVAVDARLRVRR